MELVVDTNIVFSAILGGRTSKVFAQAIININMHTIDTIIQELQHNIDKITRYTTLDKQTIQTLIHEILREDLTIHKTKEIPHKTKEKAKKLAREVDPDDWPFIALAMYLKVPLWTGDKSVLTFSVRTKFKHYMALDTRAVEILLEGKSWDKIKKYLKEKYGEQAKI